MYLAGNLVELGMGEPRRRGSTWSSGWDFGRRMLRGTFGLLCGITGAFDGWFFLGAFSRHVHSCWETGPRGGRWSCRVEEFGVADQNSDNWHLQAPANRTTVIVLNIYLRQEGGGDLFGHCSHVFLPSMPGTDSSSVRGNPMPFVWPLNLALPCPALPCYSSLSPLPSPLSPTLATAHPRSSVTRPSTQV